MRIIGGKLKNKKILFHINLKTRPLKDSVRENIFNILDHSKKISVKIKGSNILDLYSGSGSFGLEALSRFASKVYFVEKDFHTFENFKKNIINFKIKNEAVLYNQDVLNFFEGLDLNVKFNIVFLDPPYADKKYGEILKLIAQREILNKNHILIIHRERKKQEKLNFKNLNILDERIYGSSKILFCKLSSF